MNAKSDSSVAPVVNIAVTKRLTLVLTKAESIRQADADVDALADPTTSHIVRSAESGSLYFHQLRLRVAQDPALADQIEVLYIADGKTHQIGLAKEDMLCWPVGFDMEAWDIEAAIEKARKPHVANSDGEVNEKRSDTLKSE